VPASDVHQDSITLLECYNANCELEFQAQDGTSAFVSAPKWVSFAGSASRPLNCICVVSAFAVPETPFVLRVGDLKRIWVVSQHSFLYSKIRFVPRRICSLSSFTFVSSSFSATMNTMQDSHKRTSISQLLNPSSDSSVYSHAPHLPSSIAVSQYQHPQHQPQGNYNQSIESDSTFHLREASWEPSEDRSAPKRRPDAAPGPGRPYQLPPHPHMHAEPNNDMIARQGRSRMDEAPNYGMPASSWSSQPDMSNPPYGTPAVAPMYSDERTGE